MNITQKQINQAQKEINDKWKTAIFEESITILEKQQQKLNQIKEELE